MPNGTPDAGEQCDDGNNKDGDGCDNDCTYTTVAILAGGRHTCALIEGGRVRCWGANAFGQLGYGNTHSIGDDETPASVGDVTLPRDALSLDLGESHTCALFGDNRMRCWGRGLSGQLGNSSSTNIGSDEVLGDLAAIMLGGTATQFSSGGTHNCARFDDGTARCWGDNGYGQLGTGTATDIGDDEPASAATLVSLGPDDISFVAAGYAHSCAVTSADDLYCWGLNNRGQLGYGSIASIGGNESPNFYGAVDVHPPALPNNATISQLALGNEHSCVLFSSGEVLCWGYSIYGQIGQGTKENWSDEPNELPRDLEPILLYGVATAISTGNEFSCALLDNGKVRCWGRNDVGQLGLGHTVDVGDDEFPNAVSPINLGGPAISISAGSFHACAVLADQSVTCWGSGNSGQLGYGNTNNVGDDEAPVNIGAIDLL